MEAVSRDMTWALMPQRTGRGRPWRLWLSLPEVEGKHLQLFSTVDFILNP